ncbi:MAG: N-acetyl-gamma-glutamyl-phosphate reductase [Clostridia bacterium]|nr:N-acetyl-gamma-glutamyl-phosphate reductase [Clostridia bacterium]
MKVFVDGSAGTTGLEIVNRLQGRKDISLVTLPDEVRKDASARKDAMLSSDLAVLCLPDDAAVEAVSFAEGSNVKIIDASTAHRVSPDFVYGLPELPGRRELIKNALRVANPGCHASGFIALVAPLVKAGVLSKDAPVSAFSLTGYTGGGKKMIQQYEGGEEDVSAPRQYALSQSHKHLKEMVAETGLSKAPIFLPVVAAFPRGMQVSVPLYPEWLSCGAEGVKDVYKGLYQGGVIRYEDTEAGTLPADLMAGKDGMKITLVGKEDRLVAIASFDNLGKGASGAAIQNLNLMLGVDETTGLVL